MTLLKDMEPEQAQAALQSCLNKMQSNDVIDLATIFFNCTDDFFTAEELGELFGKTNDEIVFMIHNLRKTHGMDIVNLSSPGKKSKYKMVGFIDKRKGRQMEITMPDFSLVNQLMQ